MWQPVAAARGRTPNAWWRTLVAALAVVVLIVGFVAVAGALSSADTSFVVAQLIARDNNEVGQPKLVATGFGRAAAPAETATLQLVIVPSGEQFANPGFRPTPQASPAADEEEAGIAAPVIDAVMSEGMSRGAITVIVSPVYGNASFYGGGASTGFRIDMRVTDPSAELLDALMTAAYAAAAENGWYVSAQGVVYGIGDCGSLEQQARAAAVADAQRQAQLQADALNAELGGLVEVSNAPAGTFALASCEGIAPRTGQMAVNNPYSFNPGGVVLEAPAYNPAQPPEAVVELRVELTYQLPENQA
ncbi:MAG: SIMPL domain-containing protein [Thermomicrobiales bacterium]